MNPRGRRAPPPPPRRRWWGSRRRTGWGPASSGRGADQREMLICAGNLANTRYCYFLGDVANSDTYKTSRDTKIRCSTGATTANSTYKIQEIRISYIWACLPRWSLSPLKVKLVLKVTSPSATTLYVNILKINSLKLFQVKVNSVTSPSTTPL